MGPVQNKSAQDGFFGSELGGQLDASLPGDGLLSYLPPRLLQLLVAKLSGSDIQTALQHGLVPVAWLPYQVYYAQCEGYPPQTGIRLVAKIRRAEFDSAIQQIFSRRLARAAAFGLARALPQFSARRRLTWAQGAWALLALAMMIAVFILLPTTVLHHVLGSSFLLFFGAMVWLRVLALNEPQIKHEADAENDDSKLPIYSVLVPMFRETSVLPQLLVALNSMNYPASKLDIKLILEESDIAMQRAVSAMTLLGHFQVLVVPSGRPQTKPRALNYALNFARGSLVTIFDAEDIPEPMQLRVAAKAFAKLPEHVACLQAELSYYNANENWLTRQFTIEYATLFKLVLPALAANKLPLPLGGTSNHFRKQLLQDVGGWDPHNVTEDADLGFRLARLGYQTDVLQSTTFEEANTKLGNWLHQRARWFKGFLQTWLVHMRDPLRLIDEIGLSGFLTLQAAVLGVVFSAAFYPIFLINSLYKIGVTLVWPDTFAGNWALLPEALYIGLFIAGYSVMIFSAAEALRRKRLHSISSALWSMPIYWLLASVAAWLAIWQLIFNPFHWNKTRHGLSRFVVRPR